jgi:alpha/beta superfamily hydrolase
MKLNLSVLILLFTFYGMAQELSYTSEDLSINSFIDGTLLKPKNNNKPILALIINDNGPTDRNGNQNLSQNNALKKLSESLTHNDIATFRYDKRIVKQIRRGKVDKNMMFDDFITDAISVLEYFKSQNSFSKIYIIGHGQGSLVGMIAAKEGADGFISLAGSGKSIDDVITEQVQDMDATLTEDTKKAFKSLKEGKTTTSYPIALGSVFNADVQAFIMNWMRYNPAEIIQTLDIPILIINGTKDLHVPVEEAKLLKNASKSSELKIIENMNHILYIIEGDDLENSKSYNETYRKISDELINSIISFIKNRL